MIEIKKGIALSIIVVLALSAMIIRINDKNYIPFKTEQKIRNKNLAMPILTTANDLGDGVYLLKELNGITLTYNVYNGYWNFYGTPNTTFDLFFLENFNLDFEVTISINLIDGTPRSFGARDLLNNNIGFGLTSQPITIPSFKDIRTYLRYLNYIDYIFTLQIEKGPTRTSYTVPNQILSAYTSYEDNLTEIEKADIGLMGITSLTKLINTVTVTIEYAKSIITAITNFIDKLKPKDNIIPPKIPGYDPGVR